MRLFSPIAKFSQDSMVQRILGVDETLKIEGVRHAWRLAFVEALLIYTKESIRGRATDRICWSYTGIVAAVDPLEKCTGFDWDDTNAHKIWDRHQVTFEEAEDVFFNEPLVVRSDVQHSKREKRYYSLGQTVTSRRLFVVFTIRRNLIRVISARDMNGNETKIYERYEEETS